MCIETEAKLKVDSLGQIARKLTKLGAEFLEEQLQEDSYFDDADSSLTKIDSGLRLRRQLAGGIEKIFLAYKGPKEKHKFKKRPQIEFEITDGDSAEKLLLAIGYHKILTVEKKRRLWKLAGCEVALDKLPSLGNFVEIEGPDEQTIADVQRNLGLSDLPHIEKSYAHLIDERLRQQKI